MSNLSNADSLHVISACVFAPREQSIDSSSLPAAVWFVRPCAAFHNAVNAFLQGLKQMQLYVGSRKGDPAARELSDYVSKL